MPPYATFQQFCPLLAYVAQVVYTAFATMAQERINAAGFPAMPNSIVMAQCWMVGHLLELSGYSTAGAGAIPGAGQVKSESVGGVSVDYAVNPTDAGALDSTFYGKSLRGLLRQAGMTNRSPPGIQPAGPAGSVVYQGVLRGYLDDGLV